MSQNRRSVINYSIKRTMQFRLLIKVMTITLLSTGLTGIFFYFFSNRQIGESFMQFHVNARSFLDLLLPVIIIALVVGIVISFAIAVFFPHSIAGPLYRIEKDLADKVGEGNLNVRFSLRKGDELKDLADALNITFDRFRKKIEKIKTASEELSLYARSADRGDDSSKKVVELAKRLEETVKEFKV